MSHSDDDLPCTQWIGPAVPSHVHFTNMYGVLVWRPVDELPHHVDPHGRHVDYADHMAGRPVLDTTRRAFDTLDAML